MKKLITLFIILTMQPLFAAPSQTQMAVWANEAIIATYSFDYQNYLSQQKDIATYFTAEGWTKYLTALNQSKLPEAVMSNHYSVSAVATYPPQIKSMGNNQWHAVMPILVIYKNPQYQQKQNLEVNIDFIVAPNGQGVRGFALTSLQSSVVDAPCQCAQPKPAAQ